MQPTDDLQIAAAVLSRRYEEQLFSQASRHGKVVPVLVITGFLGSGKTTLLQHLLATSGHELKLGVLVNEVAALDVDGQLLKVSQSNAAAGIKAAQLAGGCACCSVSSNLQSALADLAGSSSYHQLDYLLLETSGVADVEPLAALLSSSGFRLAGVVTVVDAEAAVAQLQDTQVALAQLQAADIVVINKCDLASLSSVSAVEDLVQEKATGVRMLRARFGQVPAAALLDVDVPAGQDVADGHQDGQQHSPLGSGVQGDIAFLSHEPVVSTSRVKARAKAGQAITRHRGVKPGAATTLEGHVHSHSHSSFSSVGFSSSEPLCMACFQSFVAGKLLTATGLFRAKGFVWFQQQRSARYVFHISGKQRAECGAEGTWDGPPGVQLVLIGQQHQQLLQLKQELQSCIAAGCCCCSQSSTLQQLQQQQRPDTVHRNGMSVVPYNAAAARFAELVQQHHRFELVQTRQQLGDLGCQSSASTGLVEFSAIGSALHGVIAAEVNASVLRKANAAPGLFLCHVKSPPALRTASSSTQVAYQGVDALQICFQNTIITAGADPSVATKGMPDGLAAAASHQTASQGVHSAEAPYGSSATVAVNGEGEAAGSSLLASGAEGDVDGGICSRTVAEHCPPMLEVSDGSCAAEAERRWQLLENAVAATLRKAYQHVHNCKCDVVQLMSSQI